jgi:hypothetical protein
VTKGLPNPKVQRDMKRSTLVKNHHKIDQKQPKYFESILRLQMCEGSWKSFTLYFSLVYILYKLQSNNWIRIFANKSSSNLHRLLWLKFAFPLAVMYLVVPIWFAGSTNLVTLLQPSNLPTK